MVTLQVVGFLRPSERGQSVVHARFGDLHYLQDVKEIFWIADQMCEFRYIAADI